MTKRGSCGITEDEPNILCGVFLSSDCDGSICPTFSSGDGGNSINWLVVEPPLWKILVVQNHQIFTGYIMVFHICLVGGWALPLWKMMGFVSWDNDIRNIYIWKNNPNVPNHQPVDFFQQIQVANPSRRGKLNMNFHFCFVRLLVRFFFCEPACCDLPVFWGLLVFSIAGCQNAFRFALFKGCEGEKGKTL